MRPFVTALIAAMILCLMPVQAQASSVGPVAQFTTVVANIRSFPTMSHSAYAHDINRLYGVRGHKVILGSEIMPKGGERALWRSVAARNGYRTLHAEVETSQSIERKHFKVLHSTRTWYQRHAAPGPFSPPRNRVVTKTLVNGYPVAFVSLHLANGCGPGNRHYWWYEGRCEVHYRSIGKQRPLVARLHDRGFTVVIGGDMNNGNRPIRWSRLQTVTIQRELMQLAVIPASGVRAHVSRTNVVTDVYTDHPFVVVGLLLSRR